MTGMEKKIQAKTIAKIFLACKDAMEKGIDCPQVEIFLRGGHVLKGCLVDVNPNQQCVGLMDIGANIPSASYLEYASIIAIRFSAIEKNMDFLKILNKQ